MTTRRKLWVGLGLAMLLVVGALVGIKALQIRKLISSAAEMVPPPETVAAAPVEEVTWEPTRAAVGTLVAARAVALTADLSGTVREIAFESGSFVRQGDLLVKLDTSTEEAQLKSALAEATLARTNLERAQRLRKAGANAPADLDASRARAQQAQAQVDALRATLSKKVILAPFDGRISIRQVELGQVLESGARIASLQSVDPIHVDFWAPQQALSELQVGQRTRLRIDTFPDDQWEGQVSVINPEVDVATRNVRVRATIANPDGRLRPGMFANVEVLSGEKRVALVIPITSVIFAPYGDSVFVLEEQKDAAGNVSLVARQRTVRLGERRGDFLAVAEGLQAGEQVVSAGAFKLRNGVPVQVNNDLAPNGELEPSPGEE